jgi:hypothetical protein
MTGFDIENTLGPRPCRPPRGQHMPTGEKGTSAAAVARTDRFSCNGVVTGAVVRIDRVSDRAVRDVHDVGRRDRRVQKEQR